MIFSMFEFCNLNFSHFQDFYKNLTITSGTVNKIMKSKFNFWRPHIFKNIKDFFKYYILACTVGGPLKIERGN